MMLEAALIEKKIKVNGNFFITFNSVGTLYVHRICFINTVPLKKTITI